MFTIAQTFQKKMMVIVNSVKRWMPIISHLGPAESQTIKVADLIHNSQTIIPLDQKFFHKAYKYEKQYMMDVLTKADPILKGQAQTMLDESWNPVK